MGKITIENIPDVVLDEVQNFFQAVINDDVRDMLDNAGYEHEATKVGTWNLHSQAGPKADGFYGDHIVWGACIYQLIEVDMGEPQGKVLIANQTLQEAMGILEDNPSPESFIFDEKIFFYVDYETWKTKGNMTNEDWVAYLQNESK